MVWYLKIPLFLKIVGTENKGLEWKTSNKKETAGGLGKHEQTAEKRKIHRYKNGHNGDSRALFSLCLQVQELHLHHHAWQMQQKLQEVQGNQEVAGALLWEDEVRGRAGCQRQAGDEELSRGSEEDSDHSKEEKEFDAINMIF